ncbi:hypothetical protein HOP61_01710 [Halomonas daqingensis]|uniref:DUF4145 domain-containing protein n=1 Tax=Billgrantia desiderata TaxID=52021 RepID=A0AAW4YPT2_9GAMM|nr:hypothetical protein [Halomonas desiderata]MCE8050011.1 hypothetical protein [Halomonas desiderata]
MRIPLPKTNQVSKERKAHPFPAQIGLQTLELMQASIFHSMVMDEAAGQRVRQERGVEEINGALLEAGLEKRLLDDGWAYLGKYKVLFERFVTQNVLIALRSQWDWYVRNLGRFILTALASECQEGEALSKSKENDLTKIGFKDIQTQLRILERCAGIAIDVPGFVREAIHEMSLVRNLGLHNRWEVDDFYIKNSRTEGWGVGEIRYFEVPELEEWHKALANLVNASWSPVAVRFKYAPDFELGS